MKDFIEKIITFLQGKPNWIKVVVSVIVGVLVAIIVAFSAVSCGSTTRAVIKNVNDSATTTVTITTNNPSSIQVDPHVQLSEPDTTARKSFKVQPFKSLSK